MLIDSICPRIGFESRCSKIRCLRLSGIVKRLGFDGIEIRDAWETRLGAADDEAMRWDCCGGWSMLLLVAGR
jgi:hypothetical protein